MKMTTKKPVVLILTDTHLSEKTVGVVKSVFTQAITTAKAKKIDTIIHAGDFFDKRDSQTLRVLKAASDIFDEIENSGLKFYIIAGNHDKADQSEPYSYVSVAGRNRKNCIIFEDHRFSVHINGLFFDFLPYFPELVYLEKLSELVSEPKEEETVLITHVSIDGVKMNGGHIAQTNLQKDFFTDYYRLTLVGHIHDKSWLNKKIAYIGGAYQQNFGEDINKGFTILYSDYSIEQIPSIYPVYRKFDVEVENLEEANQLLRKYSNTSDHVRIKFRGGQDKLSSLDVTKFKESGISVKFENTVERSINIENPEEVELVDYSLTKKLLPKWIEYGLMNKVGEKLLFEGVDRIRDINQ